MDRSDTEDARSKAQQLLKPFRSDRFKKLRRLQEEALTRISAAAETERDLAVEMPTGTGKTLVGLLAASTTMAQGGSAVYLTSTNLLADAVVSEAAALGVRTELMSAPLANVPLSASRRVNSGKSLGVMAYASYFSNAEVVDPPGLLIFDDAHSAEDKLLGRYALNVQRYRHDALFRRLFELIASSAPGYSVVDDFVSGAKEPSRLPYVLAFSHVQGLLDRALAILDAAVGDHDDLRYPYKRIKPALARCLWLVGPSSLLVRPLRLPLTSDPVFSETSRRLYLSATLGDLTDLRRRLGTPPIYDLGLPRGHDSAIPGHRFFVARDRALSLADSYTSRARLMEATPRRVWFCRSQRDADKLAAELPIGSTVIRLSSPQDRDEFLESNDADLLVVGRYEGHDFAGDQARLAFFPSGPYMGDVLDEFFASNFSGAGYVHARVAQRLTQAFGRLTRGEDDWAVLVIEDEHLARQLTRNEVLGRLPFRLAGEIDAAMGRAENGDEANSDTAISVLTGAVELPVDGDWRRKGSATTEWPRPRSDSEAAFGDALYAGTFDAALPKADMVIQSLGDHSLRPWWLYLRAWTKYLSAIQDGRPDRAASSAADLRQAVRSAGGTTWFSRVEASINEVQHLSGAAGSAPETAIHAFVRGFRSQAQLDGWIRPTLDDLMHGDHKKVTTAWTKVGSALGYEATTPEGPAATDCLWRDATGTFVFEVKVDHEPDANISRRDVNQLLAQIQEQELAGGVVIGAFLTHLEKCHEDVGPLAGSMTLMSLEVAGAIWSRAQDLLAAAREDISTDQAREHLGPPEGWLQMLLGMGRGRRLVLSDIESVWPRKPL